MDRDKGNEEEYKLGCAVGENENRTSDNIKGE